MEHGVCKCAKKFNVGVKFWLKKGGGTYPKQPAVSLIKMTEIGLRVALAQSEANYCLGPHYYRLVSVISLIAHFN